MDLVSDIHDGVGVRRIPLGVFETQVRALPCWESLGAAADELERDPAERLVVDDLVTQWHRRHGFAHPVRVEAGELVDGYHRWCAARAVGATYIDITDTDVDSSPVRLMEARFAIDEVDTRLGDLVARAARSVPVGDSWADADVVVVSGDTLEVYLHCDISVDPGEVATAVILRLAKLGVQAAFIDATENTALAC